VIGAAAVFLVLAGRWKKSGARPSPPLPSPPLRGCERDSPVEATCDKDGSFPRRGDKPVDVLIRDRFATSTPALGWVINCSPGGLCLSVGHLLWKGTILSVRATDAPVPIPSVEVSVQY